MVRSARRSLASFLLPCILVDLQAISRLRRFRWPALLCLAQARHQQVAQALSEPEGVKPFARADRLLNTELSLRMAEYARGMASIDDA